MNNDQIISKTSSICPVCLKRLDAKIVTYGNESFMEKSCLEHGFFKTIVWKGSIKRSKWQRKKESVFLENALLKEEKGCPFDCGLCSEHRQHTCTALIEVTQSCNLKCRYCFADSFSGKDKDPTIDQIRFMYESVLKSSGACNIQLSGGEPTLREDLPLIISTGIEMGFQFIQINTNGIRISEDDSFVKKLKEAGLSSIFLQFDGTRDDIYKKLRGRELLDTKIKAIEKCKKYGIGVVLVPTLVPKVNVDNIGEIIDFGLANNQAVRGVHFQPVSYFGRVPYTPRDEDRITLPEVIDEIVRQTNEKIKIESLLPPGCENSLCSFHGNYIYMKNKSLMNITNSSSCSCKSEKNDNGSIVKISMGKNKSSCGPGCGCKNGKKDSGSDKAKLYVSRNWSNREKADSTDDEKSKSRDSWDEIINTINSSSFSISGMAFQDAFNLDIERVKDCCIHVVNPDGRLIPFCLYNLTNVEGKYLYRK